MPPSRSKNGTPRPRPTPSPTFIASFDLLGSVDVVLGDVAGAVVGVVDGLVELAGVAPVEAAEVLVGLIELELTSSSMNNAPLLNAMSSQFKVKWNLFSSGKPSRGSGSQLNVVTPFTFSKRKHPVSTAWSSKSGSVRLQRTK
jgi:hypothetical protein